MTDEPRTPDHDCSGDAAAYALGALDPAEAETFRRHLATCAICRDEIAAFRTAVEALPLSARQYEAPPELRKRVMTVVRDDVKALQAAKRGPVRRRSPFGGLISAVPRPALALVVTVVAIAVGLVGGLAINSGGSGTRVVSASVGNAQVKLMGARGELVVGKLPTPPPGEVYEVWLLHRGAKAPRPTRTLFGVTRDGTADVGLVGSLNGVTDVLVTPEPAGGSLSPTHAPVIVAKLA